MLQPKLSIFKFTSWPQKAAVELLCPFSLISCTVHVFAGVSVCVTMAACLKVKLLHLKRAN
jgi:hypothetical protein